MKRTEANSLTLVQIRALVMDMRVFFFLLITLLFISNNLVAQKWGEFHHEDLKIVDFSYPDLEWKSADGQTFGWKENTSLSLPKSLDTKTGKKISVQDLGYESSSGRLVFTASSGGKKFPIYRKLTDLGLTVESATKLNEYLLELESKDGRKVKGFLLGVSPDFKSITLASGVEKKLFKNNDSDLGKVEFARKTFEIPISKLSQKSQKDINQIHRKKYLTLFEIAAEITERKIKHFEALQQNAPVDEEAEKKKIIENLKLIEERDKEISEIRELNEPKLRAWQEIHSAWEKDRKEFLENIDEAIRSAERKQYENKRDKEVIGVHHYSLGWVPKIAERKPDLEKAIQMEHYWVGIVQCLKDKRSLYLDGDDRTPVINAGTLLFAPRASVSSITWEPFVSLVNAKPKEKPEKPKLLSLPDPIFKYTPKKPWTEYQKEEENNLKEISKIRTSWDKFIINQ